VRVISIFVLCVVVGFMMMMMMMMMMMVVIVSITEIYYPRTSIQIYGDMFS